MLFTPQRCLVIYMLGANVLSRRAVTGRHVQCYLTDRDPRCDRVFYIRPAHPFFWNVFKLSNDKHAHVDLQHSVTYCLCLMLSLPEITPARPALSLRSSGE